MDQLARVYEDATLGLPTVHLTTFGSLLMRYALWVWAYMTSPFTMTLDFDSGQYPIEIVYAHRSGSDNGLRFRLIGILPFVILILNDDYSALQASFKRSVMNTMSIR